MAFVASGEFAQHCFIVRFTVAILTLGYNCVLISMAENAQEASMFCRTGFKRTSDILVAGTTVLVGNFLAKGKR